jgi:hypothetical protein
MTITRVMPRQRAAGRAGRPWATGRIPVRLWALIHAQVLLGGCPGAAREAASIEDDRRRLSHRPQG